ncbi:hypothetical protein ZIOFF_072585 [Zingiber officinale]|uniref:E3 ubiquitin-protein ligase RMA n=1 Tax=Zingiber officinale TaxID=94328 RepID=A0A8J5CRZ7_ZINOF|nr:hypothetical protein ZIOFF_072585 [Zingiber officinale]
MDPCLYNSLPSLPPPESRDLGSPWSPSAHAPYSPSNVLSTPDVLPADPAHAADSVYPSSSELLLLYDEHDVTSSTSESPGVDGNEPLAREPLRLVRRDVDAQIAVPSPSQPSLRAGHDRVETAYAHVRLSELTARGNTLSAQHQLLQHPEYRFQRLLELLRIRRSITTEAQGLDAVPNPLTNPERLMHDIMQSHRAMEDAKKATESEKSGDVENKKDDSSAANFECNICYELAKAPVVTPCGHLYCWSCLYQWLHAHSVNSECPVCKGQVLEVNVTPIYGRGGDETKDLKQDNGDEESGLKIPPRPSANRIENLRPQLRQRLEEGIANSWRNSMNEDTHDEHRTGPRSSRRQERSSAARTAVRRRPVRRMQREEGRGSNSTGIGLHGDESLSYPIIPPLVFHGGVVPFQQAGLSSLSNSLEPLLQHRDSAGSKDGPSTVTMLQRFERLKQAISKPRIVCRKLFSWLPCFKGRKSPKQAISKPQIVAGNCIVLSGLKGSNKLYPNLKLLAENSIVLSGTTPKTVADKEWWEATDKKFQAWPRTAGPPVVMNPISRQNFIVKSPES